MVYIREAHALDSRSPMTFGLVEDPIKIDERQDLTSKCMLHMKLDMDAVVDTMDDHANAAYGGWPTRLYLVGKDGKIAYAGGRGPFLYSPDEIEAAIKQELAKIKSHGGK